MSSLARRRNTTVFGSRRWWQGGCWSSRAHQEAYLRKLYSRKNVDGSAPIGEILGIDNNGTSATDFREKHGLAVPWSPSRNMNDVTAANHYLDDFLRNRRSDEDEEPVEDSRGSHGCTVLPPTVPRPSPTEKCVEFLTGARSCVHFGDNNVLLGNRDEDSPSSCQLEVTEHNLDRLLHSGYRETTE